MREGSETIMLEKPIYAGENMEMGVLDYIPPKAYINITKKDYIKLARYKFHSRRYLGVRTGQNFDEELNKVFQLWAGYGNTFIIYGGGRFTAQIDPRYIVVFNTELANQLGLPTNLKGIIRGDKRRRELTSSKWIRTNIKFFESTPKKIKYHISAAYYNSKNEVYAAFQKMGLSINKDGKIITNGIDEYFISPSLSTKWSTLPTYDYMFLCTNLIPNETVGDIEQPILRIISNNSRRDKSNSQASRRVAYKRIQHSGELYSLTFTLMDIGGNLVNTLGIASFTLHIRNAANTVL